jgi:hypothetical protein
MNRETDAINSDGGQARGYFEEVRIKVLAVESAPQSKTSPS